MAKFNYRELYRAVATSEIGEKRVNTVMQRKFEENKALLIREFNEHPVTKEIENGIGAENASNTLNGEGDLYSFIGFDAGSDPVQPVREILQDKTVLISTKKADAKSDRVSFKFSLRVPTEEIRKASPLPWEGGVSWVEGIEKGISGFGNYIRGKFRSPEPSRSGGGRQASEEIRQAEFKKRAYLSELVRAFVEKFK